MTRLCYCGPVLHTRPSGLHATREPLQFGAEIYGHAGLEADVEIQELALASLALAGFNEVRLDLSPRRRAARHHRRRRRRAKDEAALYAAAARQGRAGPGGADAPTTRRWCATRCWRCRTCTATSTC